MKKTLLTIAVACSAVLGANAQTPDLTPFFRIDEYLFSTVRRYTIDFNSVEYTGEDRRAGQQAVTYQFIGVLTADDIPEIQLDTLTSFFSLSDMYGGEHYKVSNSSDVLTEVNEYLAFEAGKFDESTSMYTYTFPLNRGGVYAARNYLDFINYDRCDTVTVYDDPSLRILGNTVVKTGSDVDIKAYYNTGYPFDINALTGEEKGKVTLYKQINDSMMAQVYSNEFKLNLKDEEHPLIAGIDSMVIHIEKPEVGAYLIRLESNWSAIEDRDIVVSVQDTLRASVDLEKQTFDLATDKKAPLHISMDYGYPHVYAVKPDTTPTIRISAVILQSAAQNDTLFSDSLKMVNDSLSTKDLLYDGNWDLDLTKIDASKLNDANTEHLLKVSIKFNGQQQYATVIPVRITPDAATGVTRISANDQGDESVYSLSGIRVDPKRTQPTGIYIRNGKKIIIK